ncbi:MAG: hypothetical protein C0504_09850 [Candidatus Solibacter sp.]|nr:hypothetical protein [Candidatus Solibacter sp.]
MRGKIRQGVQRGGEVCVESYVQFHVLRGGAGGGAGVGLGVIWLQWVRRGGEVCGESYVQFHVLRGGAGGGAGVGIGVIWLQAAAGVLRKNPIGAMQLAPPGN